MKYYKNSYDGPQYRLKKLPNKQLTKKGSTKRKAKSVREHSYLVPQVRGQAKSYSFTKNRTDSLIPVNASKKHQRMDTQFKNQLNRLEQRLKANKAKADSAGLEYMHDDILSQLEKIKDEYDNQMYDKEDLTELTTRMKGLNKGKVGDITIVDTPNGPTQIDNDIQWKVVNEAMGDIDEILEGNDYNKGYYSAVLSTGGQTKGDLKLSRFDRAEASQALLDIANNIEVQYYKDTMLDDLKFSKGKAKREFSAIFKAKDPEFYKKKVYELFEKDFDVLLEANMKEGELYKTRFLTALKSALNYYEMQLDKDQEAIDQIKELFEYLKDQDGEFFYYGYYGNLLPDISSFWARKEVTFNGKTVSYSAGSKPISDTELAELLSEGIESANQAVLASYIDETVMTDSEVAKEKALRQQRESRLKEKYTLGKEAMADIKEFEKEHGGSLKEINKLMTKSELGEYYKGISEAQEMKSKAEKEYNEQMISTAEYNLEKQKDRYRKNRKPRAPRKKKAKAHIQGKKGKKGGKKKGKKK